MPGLLEDSHLIAEPKIMPKILNSETHSLTILLQKSQYILLALWYLKDAQSGHLVVQQGKCIIESCKKSQGF
jgi:hypothetical protein